MNMDEISCKSIAATEIKESDMVALVSDMPDLDLKAGMIGTVVHVYSNGRICEIEFKTSENWVVWTLCTSDFKKVEQ
jgi:hypothetical protein